MGIRSAIEMFVQMGNENSLEEGKLVADVSVTETLDTLDKAESRTIELEALEANVLVDKGDIETIRFLLIEANGDIDFYLGGSAPTTAQRTAVAGTYPTAFAGGETLDLEIDGVVFTVTFDVADQLLADVIKRINAASAFNGIDGLIASNASSQLRLTSQETGSGSQVSVVGGTGRATLGLAVGETLGVDPTPNSSPIRLRRLADPDSSQIEALKTYALMNVQTTSLYVSNPSTENSVRARIVMAGALVPAPEC